MFRTIQKYIKGYEVNKHELEEELKKVPKIFLYKGIMYRGMRCNPKSINEASYASWSKSKDTAIMFAGQYGIVLEKTGIGVDIQKLKQYYYWTCGNKYEYEVISDLRLNDIKISFSNYQE